MTNKPHLSQKEALGQILLAISAFISTLASIVLIFLKLVCATELSEGIIQVFAGLSGALWSLYYNLEKILIRATASRHSKTKSR